MNTIPTNRDDIIDSRDVIDRIVELRALLDDEIDNNAEPLSNDERAELTTLTALAEEGAACSSDWSYGETLIRDDHFEDYARELAVDTGMITGDEGWPLDCIDWEKAASELLMDYTSVNFDGVTYWIRSC